MVIVSQVKNRGVLPVLSEEVNLKEASECGQGLGSPDICRKVIPPLRSKGGEGAGSGGRGA
ncbi:UNVERIFIED_CONTAM: hypothetical protein FKN15_019654 [Acipenser sinensis]